MGMSIRTYEALPRPIRERYGFRKQDAVLKVRKKYGLGTSKFYTRDVHTILNSLNAFDALAVARITAWQPPPPPPQIVFPFGKGTTCSICQEWHETAGLPGNWAFDFCAAPGTAILAPERMTLLRLSGHPPSDDSADAAGIFGWSQHFQAASGYHVFVTHEGSRDTDVGQTFVAGQIIGRVGDQRYRPDHTHIGYTSPKGEWDARNRINTVAHSPRVVAIA